MAKIRVVDAWLRSPLSGPSYVRSVMVIAEKWAEQRVLMRAYASGRDQIAPTILLQGNELAIGPAGLDANGPWGIHVAPLIEGRAQELVNFLEVAARRIAGSKGNPPRLVDEDATFDREPTGNWDVGAPRLVPSAARSRNIDPAAVAASADAKTYVPMSAHAGSHASPAGNPATVAVQASSMRVPVRTTPQPRRKGGTADPNNSKTALGFQSGAGAQSALVRLGLSPSVSARLARLAPNVVSADFQISALERMVLNMLGDSALYGSVADVSADDIGQLIAVGDPVTWMEELTYKLEKFGIPLVEPGEPINSQPSYRLRF
jgi:hypothetical protein